jgi:DNA-binding MarR family transcriptional regulator
MQSKTVRTASAERRARPPRRSREGGRIREVLDDLRKIVRDLRVTSRNAERAAGISGAQLFVLQVLADGRVTSMNELAERTFTDQSSVSVVVRRLVEGDLVTRKPSPEDARRVELQLTPAGRVLLRRCPEPMQMRMVTALERMKPADLEMLRRGLGALIASVGLDAEEPEMFFADEPPRDRSEKKRALR